LVEVYWYDIAALMLLVGRQEGHLACINLFFRTPQDDS